MPYVGQKERVVRHGRSGEPEPERPKTSETTVQNLKFTKKDLDKVGFTLVGCKRCEHMIQSGTAKGRHTAHSADCRHRIAEELRKTKGEKERMDKILRRRERFQQDQETNQKSSRHPIPSGVNTCKRTKVSRSEAPKIVTTRAAVPAHQEEMTKMTKTPVWQERVRMRKI